MLRRAGMNATGNSSGDAQGNYYYYCCAPHATAFPENKLTDSRLSDVAVP